jgi:NAD+ kinase
MDEPSREGPAVGVVGDDRGDVRDALAAAGARPVEGGPVDVLGADPETVVAVGESALLSLARELPAVPVLPVGAGPGVRSVSPSATPDAVDRLLADDLSVEYHPVLGVDRPGGTHALALFDAMLVTANPADISEFSVAAAGERVARFRGDGVVAATPAGSPGYARSAGGPVVGPGTDVLAAMPVAPFATDSDHWVLPLEGVVMTVERDEAAVEVLVDDRSVGSLGVDESVRLSTAGRVGMVRVPEGVSPYDGDAELEKL